MLTKSDFEIYIPLLITKKGKFPVMKNFINYKYHTIKYYEMKY